MAGRPATISPWALDGLADEGAAFLLPMAATASVDRAALGRVIACRYDLSTHGVYKGDAYSVEGRLAGAT